MSTRLQLLLQSQYGNSFYYREKGEDAAIIDAVEAMAYCLLQEEGCTKVPDKDLVTDELVLLK